MYGKCSKKFGFVAGVTSSLDIVARVNVSTNGSYHAQMAAYSDLVSAADVSVSNNQLSIRLPKGVSVVADSDKKRENRIDIW